MSNIYLGFHFTVEPKDLGSEILIAELGELPFESFIDSDLGIVAYIQKDFWTENLLDDLFILNSPEVWASWCGDCVKAMPKIHELQTNNPDVDYMFISMDKTDNQWKEGIAKYDLKGEHFMAKDQMKGVFAKAIDLDWIPRYIIVDKTGKIVLYRATETDFDQINTTLKKLKK